MKWVRQSDSTYEEAAWPQGLAYHYADGLIKLILGPKCFDYGHGVRR